MNIRFLNAAQVELDDAFDWYENQKQSLGLEFLDEFDSAVQRIVNYPELHLQIDENIHRCLFKRFPYSVIYGIDVENIVIIAIAHQHRKPDYWQNRLN